MSCAKERAGRAKAVRLAPAPAKNRRRLIQLSPGNAGKIAVMDALFRHRYSRPGREVGRLSAAASCDRSSKPYFYSAAKFERDISPPLMRPAVQLALAGTGALSRSALSLAGLRRQDRPEMALRGRGGIG